MIGKVTALFKTERWFKRPRLDQIRISISKSAVDFERIFEVEKRLKK